MPSRTKATECRGAAARRLAHARSVGVEADEEGVRVRSRCCQDVLAVAGADVHRDGTPGGQPVDLPDVYVDEAPPIHGPHDTGW